MKRKNMRMFVSVITAFSLSFCTGLPGFAADETVIVRETHHTDIIEHKLSWTEMIAEIPKAAEVAVDTQEWYQKAVSNVEKEAEILAEPREDSEAVGRMYASTIVSVEEKGDGWSKVSSGEVRGYVQTEKLAFGQEAVVRSEEVCPEVTVVEDGKETVTRKAKEAKTIEQIQKEEAEKRAKEEAARRAKEEAERKAKEEAEKKAAEAKKEENRPADISSDDRTLLAAIIHCEAGGEPYEGQVAVGAVIMNRVRSSSFPNTVREVVYQKGQFGPAITGKLDRVLASGEIYNSCYEAADAALAGENPVGEALYFGNGSTGQLIGNHYFH